MFVAAIQDILILQLLCAKNVIIHGLNKNYYINQIVKIVQEDPKLNIALLAILSMKEVLMTVIVFVILDFLMMDQLSFVMIVIFRGNIKLFKLFSETCNGGSSSSCLTCSDSNNRELNNTNECPCKDEFY